MDRTRTRETSWRLLQRTWEKQMELRVDQKRVCTLTGDSESVLSAIFRDS